MRGQRAGAWAGSAAPRPSGRRLALSGVVVGCCSFFWVVLCGVSPVSAQTLEVEEGAVGGVLQVLEAPTATEPPVVEQTEEGFIRFLGAPSGGRFIARSENKSISAVSAAEVFIADHGKAFGVLSTSTTFKAAPPQSRGGSDFVRMNQFYGDLPVFGGQIVVQLGADRGIRNILSDIMRDTRALDDGSIALSPAVSSGQALASAAQYLADRIPGLTASDFFGESRAALQVFRPSVVGLDGQTRVVWNLRVGANSTEPVHYVVLVDAQSGQVALSYSLVENALDRQIFDADGALLKPSTATRSEGQPASGIDDVDLAYQFYGDTYNYYFNEHAYDSYDGNGSPLIATVNLPFENACWGCSFDPGSTEEGNGDITEMSFGIGFVTDDITAHELTHGVTQSTSDLIYFGFSGAINESFSDMWGEWVDQNNGSANDTDANRWYVGEELFVGEASTGPGLAIRYMKDPTEFGHPDRLGSPFLLDPEGFLDNGGVHINSGIGNKLCYLLTDGDSFNGYTIEGFGSSVASDLFFGTQFLLSPGADYTDLYLALGASALDMGLTFEERLNIANAGRAVEIVPALVRENGLRNFRALATEDTATGNPVIALSWTNPDPSLFTDVVLLRNPTRFPANLNDGEKLAEGTLSRFLDRNVLDGQTYYYSVIADLTTGLPEIVSSVATAGAQASDALTEVFGGGANPSGRNTVDLSFSQLVFTPVGPSANGPGSFNNYEATYIPDAFSLPVPREDERGRASDITSPQDSGVILSLGAYRVPFFGQPYSQLFLAANGYISFQTIASDDPLNFPSLDSHFAIPRLSYLFSGSGILGDTLASSAGGSMWYRELDDRIVVTYENVPQFNPLSPTAAGATSTVQVEMFYGGLIRITYLEAIATSAVVGLSDGRGVPVDPAGLFPGILSVGGLTDFTELPSENELLSINPIPVVNVAAGDLATFEATVSGPLGGVETPLLTASWDGPGAVPFADNGDGTGSFHWQTSPEDDGAYVVRVTAKADGQIAFQDVLVRVGFTLVLPQAVNLALVTGETGEDPTEDRAVADESSLRAAYTYYHPYQEDGFGFYDEGESVVYWYRNNQVVSSLTNRFQVSPQATRGGDVWYFGVVPVSFAGLSGAITFSPKVTISGIPELISVTPPVGSVLGGEKVRIAGSRLSAPVSVTFGGVNVTSIRAIGTGELEVTTPVHASGTVDVVVNTINGPGILHNAFTFLGGDNLVEVTDVNNDGKINALDVQIVVNAVLRIQEKATAANPDANRDGQVNASDIQVVVNKALHR